MGAWNTLLYIRWDYQSSITNLFDSVLLVQSVIYLEADIQWKTRGSGAEKRAQVFICFYHPLIEQEVVSVSKRGGKKEANAYIKTEEEIIIPSYFNSDDKVSEEEEEEVQSSTNKRSNIESQTLSSACTKRRRVQGSETQESDSEEEDPFQEAPAYNTRRAYRQKDIE